MLNGIEAFVGSSVRVRVGETAYGERVDRSLGAAGDDGVGIAVLDGAVSLACRVSTRGASRHDGQTHALSVELDGDVTRRDIGYHHGDEQRRNAMYALVQQLLRLGDEGLQTADARTDVGSQTLGVDILAADQTAVHHRLIGRSHGVLAIHVAATHIGRVEAVGRGIEVLHLTCNFYGQIVILESLYEVYAALSGRQIIPELRNGVSYRRDNAQTGNDYSMFHINFDFYFVHSIIQAPVVNPAPNALNTNLSPFCNLPSRLSSSSRMGTLADEVLP